MSGEVVVIVTRGGVPARVFTEPEAAVAYAAEVAAEHPDVELSVVSLTVDETTD